MQLRFFLLIFSILISFTAFADEQSLDSVIAVVNSEVITQSQLVKQEQVARNQMLAANVAIPSDSVIRKQALDQLIDTNLVLQIAKKAKFTISDDQVTAAITQIAARNGMTLPQLQEKITEQGMTYENYKDEIQKEMIVSQIEESAVAPHISISDQDINNELNTMKSGPSTSSTQGNANQQYHVIDILVPTNDNPNSTDLNQTKKQANALLTQLQKSSKPQTLLQNNTQVQTSDLGWRMLNQLPDLFIKPVSTLSQGQFSNPVLAPNGYHILYLLSTSTPPQTSNPLGYTQGANEQTNVNLILIKKNPLFTDAEMQVHLQDIRNQAVQSNDFAKVAENNSEDPNTSDKGGNMGWVSPGALPLPIELQMNQMKVGEISQPIASNGNYYIIQVVGRKQISDANEALRDKARQAIYQQKFEIALQNWLQNLRNQSYVKVYT